MAGQLLLVEPHALFAKALKWGLEEEGFAVDAVRCPEGADTRVREEEYDLILVDLPADAGLDALRRWRRGGLRSPVLVFLDPGKETEPRPEVFGQCFDTLSKPFGLEDLLSRVRTLVPKDGEPRRKV